MATCSPLLRFAGGSAAQNPQKTADAALCGAGFAFLQTFLQLHLDFSEVYCKISVLKISYAKNTETYFLGGRKNDLRDGRSRLKTRTADL